MLLLFFSLQFWNFELLIKFVTWQADMIVVDPSSWSMVPLHDWYVALLYALRIIYSSYSIVQSRISIEWKKYVIRCKTFVNKLSLLVLIFAWMFGCMSPMDHINLIYFHLNTSLFNCDNKAKLWSPWQLRSDNHVCINIKENGDWCNIHGGMKLK